MTFLRNYGNYRRSLHHSTERFDRRLRQLMDPVQEATNCCPMVIKRNRRYKTHSIYTIYKPLNFAAAHRQQLLYRWITDSRQQSECVRRRRHSQSTNKIKQTITVKNSKPIITIVRKSTYLHSNKFYNKGYHRSGVHHVRQRVSQNSVAINSFVSIVIKCLNCHCHPQGSRYLYPL